MAATQESHESRERKRAWQRCLDLKHSSWQLPSSSRQLILRDKKFFCTSPILHVQLWNHRVDTAISFMNNLSPGSDIRNYARVITRTMVRRQRECMRQNNNGENNNMEQESEEDTVPDLVEPRLQTQTTLDAFIVNNTHA